jgi:hypothetical protein
MEQVAANLGLKPPPLDSTAEEVMVHLSLMRRPENHFASPDLRRHAMLRSARSILLKLSIGVLGVGLIWATWNLSRVLKETEADQKITQQITALNRERDEIARSLPTFGVGGSTMRDAVTFYNSAMQGFPAIVDLLVPLSQVLRSHPDIRLTQIAWQATDDLKEGPKLQVIPPRNAPPVKAIAKSGEAQQQQRPGDDGANPPFAGGRYEIALLEATVRVGANDFRGALSEAERFASDIAKSGAFQADIVESPLDVRPALTLQGRHPEREAAFMETRFVVRIVRERRSGSA